MTGKADGIRNGEIEWDLRMRSREGHRGGRSGSGIGGGGSDRMDVDGGSERLCGELRFKLGASKPVEMNDVERRSRTSGRKWVGDICLVQILGESERRNLRSKTEGEGRKKGRRSCLARLGQRYPVKRLD